MDASIAAVLGRGDTLRGTEVTFDVGGVRTRADIVAARPDGTVYLIEAKNGPYANLTKNQKIAYPILREIGG